MNNLPPELDLNFIDENDDYVCTDEPDMDVSDITETTEHLVVNKQPINHEVIFDDEVKEIPQLSEEPINKETGETNPNFIYDDDLKTNNEPDEFLIHKDQDLQTEPPSPRQIKQEKPIKLNKNGKPRKKRVYTEEQKQKKRERMKKAREQSGKNKAKKQEERAKEKKYNDLMKQKKLLDMEETEERIKKKSQPKTQPKPIQAQISKEALKQAQFEAIVQYETIRKARKAKKREQQQIKQYEEDVKTNLKKELGWRDVAGVYADCF